MCDSQTGMFLQSMEQAKLCWDFSKSLGRVDLNSVKLLGFAQRFSILVTRQLALPQNLLTCQTLLFSAKCISLRHNHIDDVCSNLGLKLAGSGTQSMGQKELEACGRSSIIRARSNGARRNSTYPGLFLSSLASYVIDLFLSTHQPVHFEGSIYSPARNLGGQVTSYSIRTSIQQTATLTPQAS